jgi:apolipoprotein N-acyltransferase
MYVLTVLYLSIAWGIFGLILAAVCLRFGDRGLAVAPFLWCAMEYVQSLGEFSFAWHSLGNTQTYYLPFIQIAGITGMFGVSFWIVSINVLLFIAWTNARKFEQPLISMAEVPKTDTAPLNVAIIQPSVETNRKWTQRNASYYQLMKQTMSLKPGKADLVVWPETAVSFRIKDYSKRLQMLKAVLKQKDAVLLGGFVDKRKTKRATGDSEGEPKSRAGKIAARGFLNVNAVFLVDPGVDEVESYEKLHLVPFGEYTPRSMPWLRSMMLDAGSGLYVPGSQPKVFEVTTRLGTAPPQQIAISAVICLESTYPHMVSKFVDKGAEALVVVANDGWYDGTWQKAQHAQISVIRAVEHRIPVIRASNTGITSVIDPFGRTQASLGNKTAGIIEHKVNTKFNRTIYSSFGNWLPHCCLVISLLVLVATLYFTVFGRPKDRFR